MPFLNKIRRYRWFLLGRIRIKNEIKRNYSAGKLKVVLGAGPSVFEGWISTDIPHFDILKEKDWQKFFGSYRADNLLVEHVLEHLTEEQVIHVLSFCHKYLKPEGCLRIAVPDGYHADVEYIKQVAPPYQGHLSIWNIDTIQKALHEAGFRVEPIEYYNAAQSFIVKDFDFTNGFIHRSRIKEYKSSFSPIYSSLILDAYKMEL